MNQLVEYINRHLSSFVVLNYFLISSINDSILFLFCILDSQESDIMKNIHVLNILSIKYIASISEEVGKLKYIGRPELKIDFNTQCLIRLLQTRLEDYLININELECL